LSYSRMNWLKSKSVPTGGQSFCKLVAA